MSLLALLLLGACALVQCQNHNYGVTTTVTENKTIRVTSTSDVWNTEFVESTIQVIQLSTNRTYVPAQPATVTSVIRVTAAPVSIVRQTQCINPLYTVVSYYTTFVSVTETSELQSTITHVDVFQHVETVPVSSVQTLFQRETSTTMAFTTVTVTSTKYGY